MFLNKLVRELGDWWWLKKPAGDKQDADFPREKLLDSIVRQGCKASLSNCLTCLLKRYSASLCNGIPEDASVPGGDFIAI